MSVPNGVNLAACALAAGFVEGDPDALLRVTVTLSPSAGDGPHELSTWPTMARGLRGLALRVAEPDPTHRDRPGPEIGVFELRHPIKTPPPDPRDRTMARVQDLWDRVMAPAPDAAGKKDAWAAIQRVLKMMADPVAPATQTQRTVTPPTHVAALAFPFERGSMLLGALGGVADRRLDLRASPSGEVRLAALERTATLSDVSFGTSGPFATGRPLPKHVARAALGHHGGLGPVFDRLHAAHRAATPDSCSAPNGPPATPPADPLADAAARRLAALQGAPVLQRLFGLAIDLEVDLGTIKGGVPAGGRFVLLAVKGAGDVPLWTLSKLRHGNAGTIGYFGPATWAEYDAQGGGTGTPPSAEGVETLDRDADGHPAYDITTVDPELAIEGDVGPRRRRDKGQLRQDQKGTLRSGGLRLLATEPEASNDVDKKHAAQGRAAAALAGADVVQDADALTSLARLDIGIDGAKGPVWRCSAHRIVHYVDPSPAGAPHDWIEVELTRLLGPANGSRRIELDSATVARSRVKITTPPPRPGAGPLGPVLPDETTHPKEHAEAEAAYAQDEKAADVAAMQAVTVAGATIAAWGGEPMGSPTTASNCPVEQELAITRIVSLPSARTGEGPSLLAMLMRFGWPYRLGLRKVFPAGVCVPLASAAARYADAATHACLPSTADALAQPQAGRRLLRHERVESPLLGLLAGAAADRRGPMPVQGAGRAIVRTAPERPETAAPRLARRMLAAPNVPLQFATLHDAFRGARAAPSPGTRLPRGGPLDGRLRGVRGDPLLVDVTHAPAACDEPQYPDPAASVMVLRLRNPEVPDAWLEQPVVVSIMGTWPDVRPVIVELEAADPNGGPRLAHVGGTKLGPASSDAAALNVEVVRARLRAGEDLALDAWCIPTIEQLVAWFDVIEVAGLLAALDADSAGKDAGVACSAALAAILGTPTPSTAPAQALACPGAGGLAAPSRGALRPLAAALHQLLLQRPVPFVAGVQTLRLTHAVSLPQTRPILDASGPSRLALVRRLFPGGDEDASEGARKGETRQGFIGAVPAERWTEAACQEGALSVLFAGAIEVDLASTSSIELHVDCADPSGDTLDDDKLRRRTPAERVAADWKAAMAPGGLERLFGFTVSSDRTVELPRRTVVPLRIDGLPGPADGLPGRRRLTLEALQAAAWHGRVGDLPVPEAARPALRVTIDAVFATSGARLLKVKPVAVGRHANLMRTANETGSEKAAHRPTSVAGDALEIWMPATRRPAPPIVHDVEVRLGRTSYSSEAHGTRTVGVRQTSRIRVRLARPWYSSGEGERLGLVLWPPSIFFRDPPVTDDTGRAIPDQLLDEDLGPGGSFVTRWAADSADAAGPRLSQLVPASAFASPDDDPASRISMAHMPLPTVNPTAAAAPTAPSTPVVQANAGSATPQSLAPDPQFMSVALLTSEPRFDVEAELWYVDFDLRTDGLTDPHVRLGLVRYQPHARDDATPTEGEEPVRLRVSTPIAVAARVLPSRAAEATWRWSANGGTDVYVTARVSRASGAAAGSEGPAARISLAARRRDAGPHLGQQATAMDSDGERCFWESWTGVRNGAITYADGTTTFTCLFTLPGGVEDDHWEHIAYVETFSRRPPGTYPKEPIVAGDPTMTVSGSDFLATLELRPGADAAMPLRVRG